MSFLKKKSFVFCTGLGLVLSAALCVLLLVLAAFCMYKQIIGQGVEWVVSDVCAGVGVFCASAAISKVRGRQALPMGTAVAAAFVTIALIVRLMAGESAGMGPWFLWLAVATFSGGVLGAAIGTGKNGRNRRRHKRNR